SVCRETHMPNHSIMLPVCAVSWPPASKSGMDGEQTLLLHVRKGTALTKCRCWRLGARTERKCQKQGRQSSLCRSAKRRGTDRASFHHSSDSSLLRHLSRAGSLTQ